MRINTTCLLAFAIATLSVAISSGVAFAQPRYHVTYLGLRSSAATAINDQGQIVGDFSAGFSTTHTFLYSQGTMTDLETQDPHVSDGTLYNSNATSINNQGQVVGDRFLYNTAITQDEAYLYSNGATNPFGATLLGGNIGYSSSARAINDSGQVVGTAFENAYVYSNGVVTYIANGAANSINAAGQITGGLSVGTFFFGHPFLYSNGTTTDLGLPPGAIGAQGERINNHGTILASAMNGTQVSQTYVENSFLLNNGNWTSVPSLAGAYQTLANGLNDSGIVVGTASYSGADPRAFVSIESTTYDLNSLLDSSGNGWRLFDANAINNSGSIVGYGTFSGAPGNFDGALLLTLVPEPSSIALAATGCAALAAWCIRRAARRNKSRLERRIHC